MVRNNYTYTGLTDKKPDKIKVHSYTFSIEVDKSVYEL